MDRQAIIERLKAIMTAIKPKMDASIISESSRLSADLALDSLAQLMMSLAIEKEFGITFDFDTPPVTVADVVDKIAGK